MNYEIDEASEQIEDAIEARHKVRWASIRPRYTLCLFNPDETPREFRIGILADKVVYCIEVGTPVDREASDWRAGYVERVLTKVLTKTNVLPEQLDGPVWIPDEVLWDWTRV